MAFFRKPGLGEDVTTLLVGVALGAAVMYALDPEGGRRRRALARDKTIHMAHRTGDVIGSRSRDLANRAKGALAETRSFTRRAPGERARTETEPASREREEV